MIHMANSFFAKEPDTMIDPAVIATIAASAATQKQPEGAGDGHVPVHLGLAVLFGLPALAGVIVWAIGAYT